MPKFGLTHPEDDRPLKKYTRLQTTSKSIVRQLDGRYCKHNHTHAQIAGSCRYQGDRIALSRFAAFYPKIFTRAAARRVLQERGKPEPPIIHEEEMRSLFPAEGDESPAKRARFEPPREPKRKAIPEEPVQVELTGQHWDEVFAWLQANLPKSGSIEISKQNWPGSSLVNQCSFEVKQIQAGKGMDKYLTTKESAEMRKHHLPV